MAGILVVGVVAGFIAGISPCILPVLPVILVAGPSAPAGPDGTARSRRRAVRVVLGLVTSFAVVTLAGSALLSALGLPQDLLRDAGLVVLALLGFGLLFPALGDALERPFGRLGRRAPQATGGGFVLGLGLGAVFVPCAGPVLAAITVLGAEHHFGFWPVALTLSFAVGVAIPLLAVALAGDALVRRVHGLRDHAGLLRRGAGVVLLVVFTLVAFNLTAFLQRAVPGYTSAAQNGVEGSGYAHRTLGALTGSGHGTLADCPSGGARLEECGSAPAFRGITAWIDTPGGRPLTLQALRGHVVLVDFWTYSCINCQRALPHVEAWYRRYRADGLVVVGVHTPEFAFEHVVSNVRSAVAQLGVRYPVAVDDGYDTWNAYHNQYWPAEYLIDASGRVRHTQFGEGDYATTENLIRQLLVAARPSLHLPGPTEVANRTPTEPTNPETYVGYSRDQYYQGPGLVQNRPSVYAFPASLPLGALGLSGTWTVGPDEATAGPDAAIELGYQARDVYLVLGGQGTLRVQIDGGPARTIAVSGIPRLYTLVQTRTLGNGVLLLHASPGVQAYDFTFG